MTESAPVVPVVANVAVAPLSDPDEIAARLVEQVTGRVRWRETVEWFGANGVTTLYEIGAGKVLSGLARRINRDIATAAVGTPGRRRGCACRARLTCNAMLACNRAVRIQEERACLI